MIRRQKQSGLAGLTPFWSVQGGPLSHVNLHLAGDPACLRLTYPADVHHRSSVAFEALAQSNQLRLVGEEADVIVGNLVGEDRLEAGRRRYVAAGGPGAAPDLLLRLHEPGEKELRCVRMRRALEDCSGERPDRR